MASEALLPKKQRECRQCSKIFTPRYGASAYCTRDCADEGARALGRAREAKRRKDRPRLFRDCDYCRQAFDYTSRPNQRFCCAVCKRRGHNAEGRTKARMVGGFPQKANDVRQLRYLKRNLEKDAAQYAALKCVYAHLPDKVYQQTIEYLDLALATLERTKNKLLRG